MSVRSATAADVATAAATLGRAFADDPVATWASGRDPVPEKLGARFFRAAMRSRLPRCPPVLLIPLSLAIAPTPCMKEGPSVPAVPPKGLSAP